MHDPLTMIGHLGRLTLWHRDRDGRDGACGWFMRAHHGDPKVLKAIEGFFDREWDNICVLAGCIESPVSLFDRSSMGWPNMSIHAIALNLFSFAAWEHFGHSRKRRDAFMRRNLFDILLFAENPNDSPYHDWMHRYGLDPNETREKRIHSAAVMIYGWILRESRPWYRHPRWHFWHWRLSWA